MKIEFLPIIIVLFQIFVNVSAFDAISGFSPANQTTIFPAPFGNITALGNFTTSSTYKLLLSSVDGNTQSTCNVQSTQLECPVPSFAGVIRSSPLVRWKASILDGSGTTIPGPAVYYIAGALVTGVTPASGSAIYPTATLTLQGTLFPSFLYWCSLADSTSGAVLSTSPLAAAVSSTTATCQLQLSPQAAGLGFAYGQRLVLTVNVSSSDADVGAVTAPVYATLPLAFTVSDGITSVQPPPGTTFVRSLSVGYQPVVMSGVFAYSANPATATWYRCTFSDASGNTKSALVTASSGASLTCQVPMYPLVFQPMDIVTLSVTNANTTNSKPLFSATAIQYMSKSFVTGISGTQGGLIFPGFTRIDATGNLGPQCYLTYLYAADPITGQYNAQASPLCQSPRTFGAATWLVPQSCALPVNQSVAVVVKYVPSLLNTSAACAATNLPDTLPYAGSGPSPVLVAANNSMPRPSTPTCLTSLAANATAGTMSFAWSAFVSDTYPLASYSWALTAVNSANVSQSAVIAAQSGIASGQQQYATGDVPLGTSPCPFQSCYYTAAVTATNAQQVYATCTATSPLGPTASTAYFSPTAGATGAQVSLTAPSPSGSFGVSVSVPAALMPPSARSASVQPLTQLPTLPITVSYPTSMPPYGQQASFVAGIVLSVYTDTGSVLPFYSPSTAINVSVRLDPAAFPQGVDPRYTKLYLYNAASQVFQDASFGLCDSPANSFDPATGTLNVAVCHTSLYAVFSPATYVPPPVAPPAKSTKWYSRINKTMVIAAAVPVCIIAVVVAGFVYRRRLAKDHQEEVKEAELLAETQIAEGLVGDHTLEMDEMSREDDDELQDRGYQPPTTPLMYQESMTPPSMQNTVTCEIIEEVIEEWVSDEEDVGEDVLYEEIIVSEHDAQRFGVVEFKEWYEEDD